jgi:lysophospholipase L1-like esterase
VAAGDGLRFERFPRAAYTACAGRIGPLANLRSSTGCALTFATDSPWIELRLERLRHHQPIPQSLALEVFIDGAWQGIEGPDLRDREGDTVVRLPTGRERGTGAGPCIIWMPPISTVVISGITLVEGSALAPWSPPAPRWLAIGDSLTQGYSCMSPLQTWPHRLMRRWDLPVWNLGVGGIGIEPDAFAWALERTRYDLVTIGLGSNQAWRTQDLDETEVRAQRMIALALSGGHGRVVWILPPWKPCEDGKGPPEFMGVPLDRATGDRVRAVRGILERVTASYAPHLTVVGDLLPHDHRWYQDGLHPSAFGFAHYADAMAAALGRP